MMAKAITGVEIARTQIRVRKVISKLRIRRSSRLQPLYGIDGTAVDAQFEINGGRPGRRGPDAAELRSRVDMVAALDLRGSQVAIEGVAIRPVIDDDEVAEAGKSIGVIDRSRMDRKHRRASGCSDIDAISEP